MKCQRTMTTSLITDNEQPRAFNLYLMLSATERMIGVVHDDHRWILARRFAADNFLASSASQTRSGWPATRSPTPCRTKCATSQPEQGELPRSNVDVAKYEKLQPRSEPSAVASNVALGSTGGGACPTSKNRCSACSA